jgi:PST family polysaccharide transporter
VGESYKRILKSTSIIGGASILNVLFGIVRIKMIAIELGPMGVGLFGLILSIISIGSQIIGLGINSSSIRKTADVISRNNTHEIEINKNSLILISVLLALSFILLYLLLEKYISELFLELSIRNYLTPVIISISLMCIYNIHIAYLTGINKINLLAKITIISSITYTFLGLLVIYIFDDYILTSFILIGPIISLTVACYFFYSLFNFKFELKNIKNYLNEIRPLVTAGMVLMAAGLIGPLGQIIIRLQIERDMGVNVMGYYQSAINITISYVGIILGAMAVDYYPRLVSKINDKFTLKRIINEQSEVAILLASPILIGIMSFTPLIIKILYDDGFEEAINITRLLVLGDVFKILSWPLGIVFLATGHSGKVLIVESFAFTILIAANYFLSDYIGLEGAAISYIMMYFGFLFLCHFFIKKDHNFSWSSKVVNYAKILFFVLCIILLSSYLSEVLAAIIGAAALILYILFVLVELSKLMEFNNRMTRISKICRYVIRKFYKK